MLMLGFKQCNLGINKEKKKERKSKDQAWKLLCMEIREIKKNLLHLLLYRRLKNAEEEVSIERQNERSSLREMVIGLL